MHNAQRWLTSTFRGASLQVLHPGDAFLAGTTSDDDIEVVTDGERLWVRVGRKGWRS